MNTMKRALLAIAVLAGGVILSSAGDALAQRGGTGVGALGGQFQYVVKFVCGELFFFTENNSSGERDGAPGQYYTDINVHNPNNRTVRVNKKFALDGPKSQVHGPVTSPERFVLDPDEALQITCADIRRLVGAFPFGATAGTHGQFYKGFVVILTRQRLDITALYTVCPSETESEVSTFADVVTDVELGCEADDGAGGFPNDAEGIVDEVGSDESVSSFDIVYYRDPSDVAAPSNLLPASVTTSQLTPGGELKLDVIARRMLALESTRLMVYDLKGQLLHDSGFTPSTELRWQALTSDNRALANGVYFYVLAAQDVFGRVGYHVGKFVVLR